MGTIIGYFLMFYLSFWFWIWIETIYLYDNKSYYRDEMKFLNYATLIGIGIISIIDLVLYITFCYMSLKCRG